MSPIDSSALEHLRSTLSPSATLNLPGDPDYTNKRWALNAERPAAIVACPATAEDVVQILAFVQGKAPYNTQQKLDLAVKGGGHTPSGASSSDGGLVIDLQPKMHSVRVDPEAKLAYVGGGIGFRIGSCQSYWCRLTLGGGFGWLTSQYGLVIDNLVQATVVTSSGQILTASDSQNPNLFWAIRGGGGNFGVVTEFVLKLHDQRPDLYVSVLVYPPAVLERLVLVMNEWFAERSLVENCHLVFTIGPTGQPGVVLQLVYNGDSEAGAKKFERFIKLGPVMNQSETIPYLKLNHMQDPFAHHGENRLIQGSFIPALPTGFPVSFVIEVYQAWLKFVTNHPAASQSALALELYQPNKWSSVPSDATAFANRKPAFNFAYLVRWKDAEFTQHAEQATFALHYSVLEARDSHFPRESVGEGGYINYLDAESRKATSASRRFGSNLSRLVEAKREYDPENLFGKFFAIPSEVPA